MSAPTFGSSGPGRPLDRRTRFVDVTFERAFAADGAATAFFLVIRVKSFTHSIEARRLTCEPP